MNTTEWLPPPDAVPPAHLQREEHEPRTIRQALLERALVEEDRDVATAWTPTGRLVSLRFLRSALRRLRWLWLGAAAIGLVAGLGYHLVVPLKYSATATLYLVQPTTGTGSAPNDLAMLDTVAVSKRAIALLGSRDLSPTDLLGKQPGTMTSDNVLVLTIAGPSPQEAVRRVDAVAKAFLTFRAQRYAAQDQAVLAAEHRQLKNLQHQASALSTQISQLPAGTSTSLAPLENQLGIVTTEIVSLESSIEQTALGTLAVSKGSKVISPGTALPLSEKKVLGLDGLSGLAAGLGGGLLLAIVIAVLSDRPRTREDFASLLGAPVELSLGRVARRPPARRSIWDRAANPDEELSALARYLGEHLSGSVETPGELVVAIDEISVTAAALLVLANDLAASGRHPVVVDATESRQLAHALGMSGVGTWAIRPETGPSLDILVPPLPWEDGGVDHPSHAMEAFDGADAATLVLATVNPSLGAKHLRSWGTEVIVTVTAGKSSAQRVGAVGELLGAADMRVSSVVLLGTDPCDESAGLAPTRLALDW